MDELNEIFGLLRQIPNVSVSKRGSGKGEFLFAKSKDRAVEVSLADQGIFVEFWNSSDEEADDPPVKEADFTTRNEMLRHIRVWFKPA